MQLTMIHLIEFEPVTHLECVAALEKDGFGVVSSPVGADAMATFDLYAPRLRAVVIGGVLKNDGRGWTSLVPFARGLPRYRSSTLRVSMPLFGRTLGFRAVSF